MFQQSILRTNFIFLSILIGVSLNAFGQKDKKQLELERTENVKKIIEAEKILGQTKNKKTVTLGQFKALENQISSRQKLLRTLDEEVDLITTEILELESIIFDINLYLKQLFFGGHCTHGRSVFSKHQHSAISENKNGKVWILVWANSKEYNILSMQNGLILNSY